MLTTNFRLISKNLYFPKIRIELIVKNKPSATIEIEVFVMLNRLMNKPAVTVYRAAKIVNVVSNVIPA